MFNLNFTNMKTILILILFIAIGFTTFAQYDVAVTNNVNTHYEIKAVYYYGSNMEEDYFDLQANGNATIDFYYSQDNNYELDHWKIYTVDCTVVYSADHVYSTSSTEQIDHCGNCGGNAYSVFTTNTIPYEDNINCRDH